MKSSELAHIIPGKYIQFKEDHNIAFLTTDSRKSVFNDAVLFFAISGTVHDGHQYIDELYRKNVRQFIIEKSDFDIGPFKDANFLLVENTIRALQQLVHFHRIKFQFPVIGITGSNGKTITKEWLSKMLSWKFNVVKTPKSYNSQIGVPLSVWQMQPYHDLGVFEAGISQVGEMDNLEKLISPSIGILTNIGPAHDEGFLSRDLKLSEKLLLFKNSSVLISCADDTLVQEGIKRELAHLENISWGSRKDAAFKVEHRSGNNKSSRTLIVTGKDYRSEFLIGFTDPASIENITHCLICLVHLNFPKEEIQEALNSLHPMSMRLEMKKGMNDCYLIDDSYSNDLAGLEIALNYLGNQHHREKKTLILSDIIQSGLTKEVLYRKTADIINHFNLQRVIGIGNEIRVAGNFLKADFQHFQSAEAFLHDFSADNYENEAILIKGARKFGFERIVARMQEQVHGTILEINLDAISYNLNLYRSYLRPETKIMVMVKAFAYGSGSIEVANLLQFHRVDYLGVAFTDEAISLRKNGISLPIMIMNPSIDSTDQVFDFRLEPEVYNSRILKEFARVSRARNQELNIHIKLDTGMHRLGFSEEHLDDLVHLIRSNPLLKIKSIFSHLAAADEPEHDRFTRSQATRYMTMTKKMEEELDIKTIHHIANSAAILRFNDLQLDMVRLGIGLYGFDNTGIRNHALWPVGTLKTNISQVTKIKKGETIGYGRKGYAEKDMRIATIAIGYADGFSRSFSNGKASVRIKGRMAPVVGNVCMDMTMIDISDIDAGEGDEVIVFGQENSIEQLASSIGTIPYEILTNVSQRVKRVYFSE
jgi:alanine racemase